MSSPHEVELSQKLIESANALYESYAGMVSVIAEIQDADITKEAGYTQLSLLIADVAGINPRFASRLISHADAIRHGEALLARIDADGTPAEGRVGRTEEQVPPPARRGRVDALLRPD